MKYRLVIFDFDGTLADTFPWFLRVFTEVADRFQFRRMEEQEIDLLRTYGARKVIEHVGAPTWKLPLIASHMRQAMARELEHITLFAGVDSLLRRLAAQEVTMAVVTSNSEENVRQVLGPENAALIRHYGCGASLFGKRPHLRRVLRESGIPPEATLCVGDEIRDLEAARSERIPFGAVTWGFTHGEALRNHGPEEFFTSLEELANGLAP